MGMGFSRRDGDGRRDQEERRRTPAESFLTGLAAGAVACVALPLLLLLIAVLREGGGGDWFREDGSAARGFAYLGTLMACAAVVGLAYEELGGGNDAACWRVFRSGGDGEIDSGKAKTVFVALLMFAALCLLCAVLVVGAGEELGRAIAEGQFLGTIFLTFLFLLGWSLAAAWALRRRVARSRRSGRDGDDGTGYWAT